MNVNNKVNIAQELQELKKAVQVRIVLLDSHLTSLKNVMLKDLDVNAFENIVPTIDNVLGDLDNGYWSQCKELHDNTERIEAIRKNLNRMYNSLPPL